MKCIQCGTDNKLKERYENQGKCKNCGHEFAFELRTATPYYLSKVTDTFFQNLIIGISVNNTLNFTSKQLFYFLHRKLKPKNYLFKSKGLDITSYIVINALITFTLGNALYEDYKSPIVYFIIAGAVGLLNIGLTLINSSPMNLTDQELQKNSRVLYTLGVIIIGTGVLGSLVAWEYWEIISLLVGVIAIYSGKVVKNRKSELVEKLAISEARFLELLNRWESINSKIPRRLAPAQEYNIPTQVNFDVTAYSFDRLVVCDSADIAQFLIANNFHFENNCAILSITGYPQSIFDTTMQMLRRNPELKVYALHNCTSEGLCVVHRLSTSPDWFKDTNVTIIDIGITPRQVLANKNNLLVEKSSLTVDEVQLPNEIRSTLTLQELQWLQAGNFVNLESFKPQQLIQIIQRRISNSSNLENNTSLLVDSGSSDTSIYMSESFG
ncbi:hypothetical protein DSM106972_063730 [Dulcicalothrix desertica PCC 7102]|uniref:Uncharacterized protein n=1 Tax=Dulcicalothrix desertica PCC 7102 TaxID=232991 RepID=A0A433V6M3_9CYAN|nr:hypothetical protein [Dulcicalothrix desertica]RUT01750.1 hypothetical protein DSM106972_063730 [Dulcicalothrix desertica PCC 7102]TWH42901.1 hypothetical protein CAL7102_06584 [Dulcicalothrix desertica PCC 7102]